MPPTRTPPARVRSQLTPSSGFIRGVTTARRRTATSAAPTAAKRANGVAERDGASGMAEGRWEGSEAAALGEPLCQPEDPGEQQHGPEHEDGAEEAVRRPRLEVEVAEHGPVDERARRDHEAEEEDELVQGLFHERGVRAVETGGARGWFRQGGVAGLPASVPLPRQRACGGYAAVRPCALSRVPLTRRARPARRRGRPGRPARRSRCRGGPVWRRS